MKAELSIIVVEGGGELVGPMDPAAIDDHHDVFARFTEGRHHLMQILPELLGIEVRHNFVEHFGGAILHRANDAEQHATRDPTPRAILHPRLTFEGFLTFDLTWAQRACRNTSAPRCVPPARTEEGKTPEDGFVCIEQNDLAVACLVFEGGEFERAVGEISRGGRQAASGAVEAYGVFFKTPRTLSRPSWTPV